MAEFKWQQPTDRSPVMNPKGWRGGAVEAIGGGNMARIWTHKHDRFEVVYDDANKRVDLRTSDGWDLVESREARTASDHALAELAQQLMNEYNRRRGGKKGRQSEMSVGGGHWGDFEIF